MNASNSTLLHFLSNNCPPGPIENGTLRAEVERLKIKIATLRKQLGECEEQLGKHEIVLSSTRRVPLDVLGIIFSFVLPDCSTEAQWKELTNYSLVCKTWHQAVHGAYSFTSQLRVHQDVSFERVVSWSRRARAGRSLKFWDTCFNCPVHRRNWGSVDDSDTNQGCLLGRKGLLQLMADGPTVDHLIFKRVRPACYRHLLGLLAARDTSDGTGLWANLKKFTLCFRETYGDSELEFSADTFDVPPSTTSLDLRIPDHKFVSSASPPLPLPIHPSTFKQLTSFSMKHNWRKQDGASLLLALSHCTNLETLTLNFASSEWSCAKGSKAVILPKLREFKFAKPQEDSLKFLNFINTPRLAHLDVFLRHPIKHHTLSSFITKQADRSQDTGGFAVSLQVSYYAADPGDEKDSGDQWDTHFEEWDIPRFIRKIPNITHLTLSNCIPAPKDRKNEDDFFGYLGCWDPETLPHLRHLKILHFPPTYPLISVEMFAEGRQLDSLVVKYDSVRLPDSCEVEAVQLAEKMRLEGHPLEITYPKICNNTKLQDMYFKSR